tara:strand:- start:147 stop:1586 length:1440 start_codon:yes stop_codon:yes gene_type:complete
VAKRNDPLFNIGDNPNLDAADTGIDPITGELLTNEQRIKVFKKRRINAAKLFGKPGAIVKYDKKDRKDNPVVNSIVNIQESLGKLSNFIVEEAKEKKEAVGKSIRLLNLRRERKKRQQKEGLLEGVGERMKNALLSPIKAIGEQARGILSRLMDAFTLIFTGWLADKGLKAIQAFMDNDMKKLKSIGMNVLAGLGAVGGIFLAMNVGILALPAIIAKVIAVIATVGSAIIGFLLSPPGLITLAIAAGIGAAILGIKKLFQIGRGGKDAEEARHKNKMMLREAGIMAYKKDGARVMRDGKEVFVKTENLTEEERSAREAFEIEQKRIKDTTTKKRQEIKEAKREIDEERKPEGLRLRRKARTIKDFGEIENYDRETRRLKIEAEKKIKEKYGEIYSGSTGDGSNITPSYNDSNISKSTKDYNLSAVEEDTPTVIVNNLESKKDGDQPLKAGFQSDVPLLASSNASNFYSTYSQLQYGVVV